MGWKNGKHEDAEDTRNGSGVAMRASASRRRGSKGLSRSCDIAEWRLILLRDNELPRVEAAALRRHLRGCIHCRESHRFIDALVRVLRDQPVPEPNDPYWGEMAERIMARIRAKFGPAAITHSPLTLSSGGRP